MFPPSPVLHFSVESLGFTFSHPCISPAPPHTGLVVFIYKYLSPLLSSQSQRQLHLSMEAHGRYIARLMEQEGIAPRGDSPPGGGALSTAAMAAAAATPAGGRAVGASPIPALELGGGRIGSGGGGIDGGMGPMAHLQFFANDDGGGLAGSPRGLDRPRPTTYRGDGAGLPRHSGDGPGALSGLGTGGIFEPHDHDPDHDLDGALAMFIGRVSSDYEILPPEDAHMHVPHQHHGGGGGHDEQLQHQRSGEGGVHTLQHQQQQLMHPPHGGGGGGVGLQSAQMPPLPAALQQHQQLMHHRPNDGGGGGGSGGDLLATAGASPDLEQILFDSEGGSGLTNSSSQGGKRARQME